MKISRHHHGFTLVEALIVSVIVAIIGIAALVTYSGYVRESRRQAVEGIADAAAVAANSYVRKTGGDAGLTWAKLQIFLSDTIAYKGSVSTSDSSVSVTYTKNGSTITAKKHY